MLTASQQRAQILAEARAIVEAAERERRSLTEAELRRWEGLMAEAERLKPLAKAESERGLEGAPRPRVVLRDERLLRLGPEYTRAFELYLVAGARAAIRSLEAGVGPSGGYLIPPTLLAEVQVVMASASPLRNLVRVWPLEREQSLGVPVVDVGNEAVWAEELEPVTEDTSVVFGKRELRPHYLSAFLLVSNKLLRSSVAASDVVLTLLGEKLARALEKAYLVGTGAGQPLGVFVASPQGISVSRDVSVGAGAVTYDGLVDMKYSLDPAFWPRARWVMHPNVARVVAKLKDSAQRPIWQESTRTGEPDRLLGFPVILSKYAPSTIASGNYVAVLGDFSFYWAVERPTVSIQVLAQLYAERDLTGYIVRGEFDGAPALEDAFVRGVVG